MRGLCLLLLASLCVATVTASIGNSSHHANGKPRIAVFLSVPLQGHLNPLISQANELSARGWLSYIMSPSSIRKHAESRMNKGVSWLDVGDCETDEIKQQFKIAASKGTNTSSESEGLYDIFVWMSNFHECAYPGALRALDTLPYAPSVAGVDFASTFGFAVAQTRNIPMVVNNADLLGLISSDVVHPSDYIPLTLDLTSIHTVGLALGQRVLNPIIRWAATWYIHFKQGKVLNEDRAKVGLPPINMFNWLAKNIIFVNSAFGLEYPRPLPPNVIMTGPMINTRGDDKSEVLSASDLAWLDSDPRPVVWVSMGTLAPLHHWQVRELLTGLSNPAYRVVWKLRAEEAASLPDKIPENIMITRWFSSQLGILKHPHTKVFISHCGINSVHEAIYYETNLLCIPMFGDQPDQGLRVSDSGVGLTASKLNFTGAEIESKLLAIIQDVNGSYQYHAQRLSNAMKLAGGVHKVADVMQDVAQFGFDAYVPLDSSYPWYARNNWDAFAVHVFIVWLLYRMLSACCRSGKKCTNSRPPKKVKRT